MKVLACTNCGYNEELTNQRPIPADDECPRCESTLNVGFRITMTYEATGKTPDGNDFEMPVEADSEDEAYEKAQEQLPEDYEILTVKDE